MTKEEFIELAKSCNYSASDIDELVKTHDEDGVKFEDIPLIQWETDGGFPKGES